MAVGATTGRSGGASCNFPSLAGNPSVVRPQSAADGATREFGHEPSFAEVASSVPEIGRYDVHEAVIPHALDLGEVRGRPVGGVASEMGPISWRTPGCGIPLP